MERQERWKHFRASLLDAGREVLILVGAAGGIALLYLLVRGDWSAAQIGGTLRIAGLAVAGLGTLMGFGATRRMPLGGPNATPQAIADRARESARARRYSLGVLAISVLAGAILLGVGLAIEVLAG